MDSFYDQQIGLFTMYMQQEQELSKLKKHRQQNPELYPKRTKRRFTNKKQQKNEPPIIKRFDSSKKLSQPQISFSRIPITSLQNKPFERSIVASRKSEIFNQRQDKSRKNVRSIEYRVLQQRPVVVPETIPDKPEKIMKRKPSSNKFSSKGYEVTYINKGFLPTIGNIRSPQRQTPDKTHKSNRYSHEKALELIFNILNIEGSSLTVSKNKSQLELNREEKIYPTLHNVSSQHTLNRRNDQHIDLQKWQKLKKRVAQFNLQQ